MSTRFQPHSTLIIPDDQEPMNARGITDAQLADLVSAEYERVNLHYLVRTEVQAALRRRIRRIAVSGF